MYRSLFAMLVAAFVSGCAFQAQTIKINPSVSVTSSQVGKGKDLYLNVVDERPKKTLGTVAPGSVGADIAVAGDLSAAIYSSIFDGLSKLSFKPDAKKVDRKAELRNEVRNLDYTVIRGFWAGTLRVDTGLKGVCVRDGVRQYEKLYRGEFVESLQVVQGEAANTGYINTSVSDAVNNLLNDKELIDCLI